MSTYGRNFSFRVPPMSENRQGRFAVPTTAYAGSHTTQGGTKAGTPQGAGLIAIGAPVVADNIAPAVLGMQVVKLATGAQAPVGGQGGIAVFEIAPWPGFAGQDPFLTTYSDLGAVPLGRAIQVVSGPYVKVVFTNTQDGTFLGQRDYKGRIMVAQAIGATPNVNPGDLLTPGLGNDTDGYWAVTNTAADGWLVVTAVDDSRGEVEARMLF